MHDDARHREAALLDGDRAMVGCFRQKETRAEFLSLVRQPGDWRGV